MPLAAIESQGPAVVLDSIEEGCVCGTRPELGYHDAGGDSGWVAEYLAEITVQRDERSIFVPARLEQRLVRRPVQPLIGNCDRIVADGADQIGRAPAEVLVEL